MEEDSGGIFETLEEAEDYINTYEDRNFVHYVTTKKTKERKDISTLDRKILWEQHRGDCPIPYDGIPFIIVRSECRNCHQGPPQKKKGKNLSNLANGLCHTGGYLDQIKLKVVQFIEGLGLSWRIARLDMLVTGNRVAKQAIASLLTLCQQPELMLVRESIGNSLYNYFMPATGTDHSERIHEWTRFILQYRNLTISPLEDYRRKLIQICLVKDSQEPKLAGYGLPVDKSIRAKINSLVLEDGLTDAKEVQRLLEISSKAEHPDILTSNRKYFPTLKDVRNHISLALRQTRYSDDDQINVMELVKSWQEKCPNDKLFFRPASVKDENNFQTLLFVHQSGFQQKLLHRYGGDIVLLDSTYKTSKYELPLFFVCVLSNVGYFIVCSFITGKETKAQIKEALDKLRSWNPHWKPNAFMCDMDQREISAIGETFKECSIYLCEFHREQCWDRWLSKRSNEALSHKQEAIKSMRGLSNSRSEDEYEENLSAFKQLEVYKSNVRFRNWFEKLWLSHKERWVHCFRHSMLAAKVNTTNGVEAHNRVLKQKYLKTTGAKKTLTYLLTVLTQEMEPDSMQRYIRENTKAQEGHRQYAENLPAFLRNRPPAFIRHCRKRINSSPLTISEEDGYFLVENETGDKYKTSILEPSCNCGDWLKTMWPCKHLLAVIGREGHFEWNLLPESYTSLPVFNLDIDCNSHQVDSSDCEMAASETEDQSIPSVRESVKELVAEITNDIYNVTEPILIKVKELLSQVLLTMNPSPAKLKVRRSRSGKRVTTGVKVIRTEHTTPQNDTRDEIGKLIHRVWNENSDEDVTLKVGPYTINTETVRSIQEELTDEVMDAYLYTLCNNAAQRVLHIPTQISTAIFSNKPNPELHDLMREENLTTYDLLIGAVNQSGNHWILVIIQPEKKKVIYLNPVGENRQGKKILRKWVDFLEQRYSEDVDDRYPEEWGLDSLTHAKQQDGISCGVYVLKFAQLYLDSKSLLFSRDVIETTRLQIARTLLGEGVSATAQIPTDMDVGEDCGLPQNDEPPEESLDMNEDNSLPQNDDPPEESQEMNEDNSLPQNDEPPEESQEMNEDNSLPQNDEPPEESQEMNEDNSLPQNDEPPEESQNMNEDNSSVTLKPVWRSSRVRVPKRKRESYIYPEIKAKSRKHCVCNMVDDGEMYWQCETCKRWFHPKCLNIRLIQEPVKFNCNDCKSSTATRPVIIENQQIEGEIEDEGESENEEEESIEKKAIDDFERKFLFNQENIDNFAHIGFKHINDIIKGEKARRDMCMERHNVFKRGVRRQIEGYGFALFSTLAIGSLKFDIIDKFLNENTRSYYFKHGRIIGLKDIKLEKMFKEDGFLARCYAMEVLLPEALTAITSHALNLTYKKAVSLLKEFESKSLYEASFNAFAKSGEYLEKWGSHLESVMANSCDSLKNM